MSIVKKAFAYDFVVRHIHNMKISDKSQRLLQYLFQGEKFEAACALRDFSFTATSDPTMVLLPAGILAYAHQTAYKSIDDVSLRSKMNNLFSEMGRGNGSEAKRYISDEFNEVVYHVLSPLDNMKVAKKESIAKSIKNRIGRISKWNHSANKIEEHVIPIFERVLCKNLYTNFYIAFNNRKIPDYKPSNIPDDNGFGRTNLADNFDFTHTLKNKIECEFANLYGYDPETTILNKELVRINVNRIIFISKEFTFETHTSHADKLPLPLYYSVSLTKKPMNVLQT